MLVGDPDKMRQGDPKSLDTGTFLIRNSERSKALLDRLADIVDQYQVGLIRLQLMASPYAACCALAQDL